MNDASLPRWLEWAREIQALSQTGLAYAKSHYDRDIFARLSGIAAEITAEHTNLPLTDIRRTFSLEPGYTTPKVDMRATVIQNDHITGVSPPITA